MGWRAGPGLEIHSGRRRLGRNAFMSYDLDDCFSGGLGEDIYPWAFMK